MLSVSGNVFFLGDPQKGKLKSTGGEYCYGRLGYITGFGNKDSIFFSAYGAEAKFILGYMESGSVAQIVGELEPSSNDGQQQIKITRIQFLNSTVYSQDQGDEDDEEETEEQPSVEEGEGEGDINETVRRQSKAIKL